MINNGLGHLAGDRMLQVVANELRGIVADYNAVIGRVGGDEFAILIENSPDVPHYQVLIDQINERLAEPTFIGDTGVAVCVSIGVAKHTGRAQAGLCGRRIPRCGAPRQSASASGKRTTSSRTPNRRNSSH
ncbi:diguanylate cyclase domain-containing protein [Kibdelosporangium aridum]|uniref:diguanylate cyclase domain-containing protein n=1 Tax=Kibdelosporangium aridum TaxID=2030 RepID=UPI0035EE434C